MGEISDMMLEGILCEGCGEFLGAAVGYPCYCRECRNDRKEDIVEEGDFPLHPEEEM